MKKFILFVFSIFLITATQAQSFKYLVDDLPSNYFKDVIVESKYSAPGVVQMGNIYMLPRVSTNNSVTLFKLSGTISSGALAYDSETKSLEPEAWLGSGPIFSFRQYKPDELGNAYQTFGIGVGLIVGTNIDSPSLDLSQLKGTIHFEIRKWASFGYGYAIVTPNENRRHYLLFNTRFDF